MKIFGIRRLSIAAIMACGIFAAVAPAHSEIIGTWNYASEASSCSISTYRGGAKLVMLVTKTGTGILAVPADQSIIDIDHNYKVNLTIDGTDLPESSASALDFSGDKVLYMGIKATALARDMPDGFAFRVKMNNKIVFDMDKSESNGAFAAFIGCSKKFGA